MKQEERRHFIFFKKSKIYLSYWKCDFRVFVSLTSFQSTTRFWVLHLYLQISVAMVMFILCSSNSFLLPFCSSFPVLVTRHWVADSSSSFSSVYTAFRRLRTGQSVHFLIFNLLPDWIFWIRVTCIINKSSTPIVCSWRNYIKSIKEQPKQNLSPISLINYLKIG